MSRAGLLAARRARRRAWRPREALHTLVRACVVAVLCAVLARRFCLFIMFATRVLVGNDHWQAKKRSAGTSRRMVAALRRSPLARG